MVENKVKSYDVMCCVCGFVALFLPMLFVVLGDVLLLLFDVGGVYFFVKILQLIVFVLSNVFAVVAIFFYFKSSKSGEYAIAGLVGAVLTLFGIILYGVGLFFGLIGLLF